MENMEIRREGSRGRGAYQRRYLPRKVWGAVSVRDVRCRRVASDLLLLDIPLILHFLDFNLLRTTSPQARFLQSLLLRISAIANGRDAIDRIMRDLDTRIR